MRPKEVASLHSRRQLIVGAAALGAAHVLASCGSDGTPLSDAAADPAGDAAQTVSTVAPTAPTPPPRGIPAPPGSSWRPGWFVTRVDAPEQRLALTFDDGPSPANTPIILDHLRDLGVSATFFVVGMNVRSFPDLARRIVDEGHEIANHSVYHEPYESVALAGQISPNQDIVRDATGVAPVANRTPGLMRAEVILSMCEIFGLYEVHTTIESTDWLEPYRSASRLVEDFATHVEPGGFAVFHDAGERRPTADAIPGIVAHARSNGYELMTATDMVNSGTPLPGTVGYAEVEGLRRPVTAGALSRRRRGGPSPGARHDTRRALESSLHGGRVTRSTRRRIVEALADIDAMRRAHLAAG